MIYLPDTSTVSLLLRAERNPEVIERYAQAEAAGSDLILCPVVVYEVRRGLEYRDATRQRADLELIERAWEWDELERGDWLVAARFWAQRRAEGRSTNDADLLIAAHATRLEATIVTCNLRHFEGLGVAMEDWKANIPR